MSGSESFNPDIEKYPDTNGPAIGASIQNVATAQSKAITFHHDRDNIYINEVPINKDEFLYAFGGTLNVGVRKATPQSKEYGDPVPAGLAAFSCTVVSLGLVMMHARGVTAANALLAGVLGFYNMYAGLADKTNSYYTVQPWFLPHAATPDAATPDEKQD
ncbi:hypothetical protein FOA43_003836 [Brettanomyces nanus]|uniref:Uncharacterized protein n=1 Tax=Eeniella nana TaxID=13502 RepID=A0A875RWR0_EENNA|nr:uncharacterized protein FOA43_003836 [Brettanomyces nanus]QPG76447.1 hypothetical protein FOA43_003836 [Brettanomyces nanus]